MVEIVLDLDQAVNACARHAGQKYRINKVFPVLMKNARIADKICKKNSF